MSYFVGVDVGSGSVRAAVFDSEGRSISHAVKTISQYRPMPNFVEQSSDDIWSAVCYCVSQAVEQSLLPKDEIIGIGFDATCSLVALDANANPVSISPTLEDEQNIIMWMDHRAQGEASYINGLDHECLKYVGGEVSLEMEIPKILWLKNNLPAQFDKVKYLLDLADFLVFKSTGQLIRSSCTMGCKWNYLVEDNRWGEGFLEQLGLGEPTSIDKISGEIRSIGQAAGELQKDTANQLGLSDKTVVAVGIIDAHAGGLATIGKNSDHSIAVISGTSTCFMASATQKRFVEGIWGPYWDAMLPNAWLLEGGQSASGALVDFVIENSKAAEELELLAIKRQCSKFDLLNELVAEVELLNPNCTIDTHVLDYHHGNRSPIGDATLTGMVTGLTLNSDLQTLAVQYLATIQSITYGARHIIEVLETEGHQITEIHMCGGATKNTLWMRELSDATGLPVYLNSEPEAVLLGSAIMAAVASEYYTNIGTAITAMVQQSLTVTPNHQRRGFHDAKYSVYRCMYKDQIKYKAMMEKGLK
ncbi:FGGY-family carbohydrate kinase [Photobacterium sp. BZF1]|uniref:FGGY-family carbohydrate kinase n=1 Tax=Photobacterium sp. BZF1 TaxID=1904457 RepID=UPI001653BC19|nr:FGGY-family carbohydrate kinase [Photobacterium sp. BZF1]MBC7005588.1 FGGY-family carbohydrate kinase [Photobacterium sp. BZF1]